MGTNSIGGANQTLNSSSGLNLTGLNLANATLRLSVGPME